MSVAQERMILAEERMAKKTVEAVTVLYRQAVARRLRAEEAVFGLSEQKLQAEAELRDARDDERRKLIAFEEAVEDQAS